MALQTCNLFNFDTLTCTSIIPIYVHVHLWVCYVSFVGLPTLLYNVSKSFIYSFRGMILWWDVWFLTSRGWIGLFRVQDSGWRSSRPSVRSLTNGLGSSLWTSRIRIGKVLFNFACTVMTLGRVYLQWVNRHRRKTAKAKLKDRQVYLSVPLKHSLCRWLKSDVLSRSFSGIFPQPLVEFYTDFSQSRWGFHASNGLMKQEFSLIRCAVAISTSRRWWWYG